jgi:regulator of sigma E protease
MDPITTMPTGGAALFWGIVTFSLLILLHEGGHFLAARAFGVKVHEFMLGLPGPALTWRSKRSGVRYGVTMIPLGGYVRIAGMEPGAEDALLAAALAFVAGRSETDADDLATALDVDRGRASALLATLEDYGAAEPAPDGKSSVPLSAREAGEDDAAFLTRVRSNVFRGQAPWKRVTILSMGVLTNLVTAVLILVVALTVWGVPKAIPSVASVGAGTPAAAAGIRAGDTITSLNGRKITAWDQFRNTMLSSTAGTRVSIGLVRAGRPMTVDAVLTARPGGGAMLGVTADTIDVPMPAGEAFKTSFSMIGQVFVAVGKLLNPRTFAVSIEGARSIVGISYEVASAAAEGPLAYAWMVALLSLSLGVMNILPIPPLDGGKVAAEFVEGVIRQPIPRKVSLAMSALGTLLLFSLIFYLMYADVMRYIVHPG